MDDLMFQPPNHMSRVEYVTLRPRDLLMRDSTLADLRAFLREVAAWPDEARVEFQGSIQASRPLPITAENPA